MPRRIEGCGYLPHLDFLAIGDALIDFRGVFAVAALDDADGFVGGQHGVMACARVIRMAMGYQGLFYRKRGVDIGVQRPYI